MPPTPNDQVDTVDTTERVEPFTGIHLPRVSITYCTQCRWMLRAAYFGQELLSTFGTQIGEIALVPVTGGVFRVELTHIPSSSTTTTTTPQTTLLWDRKAESGFPETKVLKQRLRDHIDPARDLGHSDVGGKKSKKTENKEEKGEGDGVSKESDGKVEDKVEKKEEEDVQNIKVDGKLERNAEDMVADMQAEMEDGPETDGGGVKLNADGSVCEDCR